MPRNKILVPDSQLIKWYQEDYMSLRDIAIKLGVSKNAIHRHVSRHSDYQPRNQSEAYWNHRNRGEEPMVCGEYRLHISQIEDIDCTLRESRAAVIRDAIDSYCKAGQPEVDLSALSAETRVINVWLRKSQIDCLPPKQGPFNRRMGIRKFFASAIAFYFSEDGVENAE